mmetsp:Transcript_8524/g.10525  ORF Transcript_8524/g.10525 Transcript_8524/m.10525 type:complete len:94 (-) Transcript_8524:85-366(-)
MLAPVLELLLVNIEFVVFRFALLKMLIAPPRDSHQLLSNTHLLQVARLLADMKSAAPDVPCPLPSKRTSSSVVIDSSVLYIPHPSLKQMLSVI